MNRDVVTKFALVLAVWLLALLAAGNAKAQVAVASAAPVRAMVSDPALVAPGASFVPLNPAVLQWSAPSRWGGGTIRAERELLPPDGPNFTDFKGLFGGFNVTGPGFSYAGQIVELTDKTHATGLDADWNSLSGAAAFQAGERFAFGVGLERTGNSARSASVDYNTTQLGMSVRVTNAIFAGLVMGTENIVIQNNTSQRGIQRYGIGWRTGSTKSQFHLEAFRTEKDKATDFTPRSEYSDMSLTTGVIEAQFWKIFTGFTTTSGKQETFGQEIQSNAWEIGWIGKSGLSGTYRRENGTTTNSFSGQQRATRAIIWSLAYAF